ncbi:hypothetical protein CPB97_005382 [Podila verticillata]|nr:hypothetical protein CPB97_005382 [Podila verticillata]
MRDGATIKKKVALHGHIGQDSKSALFPTIDFLSTALVKVVTDLFSPNGEFTLVARGKIPLVIEVDNRDEIICIIKLKELDREYLAEAEIRVILKPYLYTPVEWTAQKCLPGAPLSNETALSFLHKAGIKVVLSALEGEGVRQLSWIAGWACSDVEMRKKSMWLVVSNK